MNDDTLNVVRGDQQREEHARRGQNRRREDRDRRRERSELEEQHQEDQHDRQNQHDRQIPERFLLLAVGSAILDADRRRQLQIRDRLLHGGDAGAHVDALEARRHFDQPLQVLAPDFGLSRQFVDRASEPSVAVPPVEFTSIVLLIASSDDRAPTQEIGHAADMDDR